MSLMSAQVLPQAIYWWKTETPLLSTPVTTLSVPLLLKVLAEKGISREKVTHVMPTHVHLDHAGGAGALMQEFPNAVLVVHPRGARHMIDPTKLIAGTVAVYGEEITKKTVWNNRPCSGRTSF